jgi:phosphomevalonate kinase
MRVTASAPGKLVLLGEYAVLEGAPALVLAVDRRARISLFPASGEYWEVVSPTLGRKALLRVGREGVEWRDAPAPELAWLASLFGCVPFAADLPPCRIQLDSDAFFIVDHSGEQVKLGLGSSAAVTVALLGALHACAGRSAPTLSACVAVHRAIQRGRGSGIDIAAALGGGLSKFELRGAPERVPMRLPEALHWCCLFSGRPASTTELLAAAAAWRESEPAAHARHMRELATISSRGVDAVASHDAASFLSSLHDYAQALACFGEAAGVNIASRGHRLLGALAEKCGVVYKSCGAGGGDVGVTFAMDHTRLGEFNARATQAGFAVVPLDADPRGLQTESAG